MLGLKKQLSVKSIIGPGMRVDGPVDFQDGLQIDGTVLGDVKANPDQPSLLVITETGSVQGAIRADHVVIGGSVVGPVQAAELLELQSKARVEGDVQYKALEMQQGAVIAGVWGCRRSASSPIRAEGPGRKRTWAQVGSRSSTRKRPSSGRARTQAQRTS